MLWCSGLAAKVICSTLACALRVSFDICCGVVAVLQKYSAALLPMHKECLLIYVLV